MAKKLTKNKSSKNKLLYQAEQYFKQRTGFEPDVKIKMDTMSVTKLMHDFTQHIISNASIQIKIN